LLFGYYKISGRKINPHVFGKITGKNSTFVENSQFRKNSKKSKKALARSEKISYNKVSE